MRSSSILMSTLTTLLFLFQQNDHVQVLYVQAFKWLHQSPSKKSSSSSSSHPSPTSPWSPRISRNWTVRQLVLLQQYHQSIIPICLRHHHCMFMPFLHPQSLLTHSLPPIPSSIPTSSPNPHSWDIVSPHRTFIQRNYKIMLLSLEQIDDTLLKH